MLKPERAMAVRVTLVSARTRLLPERQTLIAPDASRGTQPVTEPHGNESANDLGCHVQHNRSRRVRAAEQVGIQPKRGERRKPAKQAHEDKLPPVKPQGDTPRRDESSE